MDERRERIIEKIKKVLELSKNNPSVEEAESAALKAQKLMAEYHVSMADIDDVEDSIEITEEFVKTGTGYKWKYQLASIVARNFRCKLYFHGKEYAVFYGYDVDAKIAAKTYEYLFKAGNKGANACYNRMRKVANDSGFYFDGKGIKNSYYIGYLEGIREGLDKQCVALMIVIPKEVSEKYAERSKNFGNLSSYLSYRSGSGGQSAKEEGRFDGRSAVSRRQISA